MPFCPEMTDKEAFPMNTNNKVALVTGGNRGIGLETGRQLAALGFTVLLGVRDLARGEARRRRSMAPSRPLRSMSPRLTRQQGQPTTCSAGLAGSTC